MSPTIPFNVTKEILGQVSLARFRRRGFFQNFLVVMTSTGLAQLLTVCFSPVLSRLYDPDEFGLYGTFLSLAGVVGAGVTLQYSEALMLPHEDQEAAGLFWAAGLSALGIAVLISLPWLLFPSWWQALFKVQQLDGWLWLVPLAALITGINQTMVAWCARRKAFRRSATVQVGRSLTANSGQTAAGLAGTGAGGLIGGALLGDFIGSLGLFFWVIREDAGVLRAGARAAPMLAAARKHKDFALYSAPQNVLNAASQGAPIVLLIHYFGVAIGGIYAFAIRALQLPMNLILTSLYQVLFQKLSEVHNQGGDLRGFFVKTTAALFGMSLLPAALGFVLAPQAFAIIFGAKWALAGEYARWLLIWLVPGFCNLPAALVGRILRQQRNLLFFDIGLLVSRITVLVLGGTYLSPLQTIVGFSIVGALFNTGLILFMWRVIRFATRESKPAFSNGVSA